MSRVQTETVPPTCRSVAAEIGVRKGGVDVETVYAFSGEAGSTEGLIYLNAKSPVLSVQALKGEAIKVSLTKVLRGGGLVPIELEAGRKWEDVRLRIKYRAKRRKGRVDLPSREWLVLPEDLPQLLSASKVPIAGVPGEPRPRVVVSGETQSLLCGGICASLGAAWRDSPELLQAAVAFPAVFGVGADAISESISMQVTWGEPPHGVQRARLVRGVISRVVECLSSILSAVPSGRFVIDLTAEPLATPAGSLVALPEHAFGTSGGDDVRYASIASALAAAWMGVGFAAAGPQGERTTFGVAYGLGLVATRMLAPREYLERTLASYEKEKVRQRDGWDSSDRGSPPVSVPHLALEVYRRSLSDPELTVELGQLVRTQWGSVSADHALTGILTAHGIASTRL